MNYGTRFKLVVKNIVYVFVMHNYICSYVCRHLLCDVFSPLIVAAVERVCISFIASCREIFSATKLIWLHNLEDLTKTP